MASIWRAASKPSVGDMEKQKFHFQDTFRGGQELHRLPLSGPHYWCLIVLRLFNQPSGNRLWDHNLYSTVAYIVVCGSEGYNAIEITSVDVEYASGILKSLPASESRQLSDHALEFRGRRPVPLLELSGIRVKAPGTIDGTFYDEVYSIPQAFEDIANISFDEIYKDLSGDFKDLLFAFEEGEANIKQDTFYYITRGAGKYTPKLLPRPLFVTPSPLIPNLALIHRSQSRSLSQSNRIEDVGQENPLQNRAPLKSMFYVRPIVPERGIFT
ncbi:hypothetical protein BDD12DRAFT_882575 [Trichophaea hybrida]|nr:hypothetical protein BDD12DRAFT_882575 [Trichophaea hybrida]